MTFAKNSVGKVLLLFLLFIPIFSLHADSSGTVSPAVTKLENPIPSITSISGFIQTLLEGVLKIGIPIIALAIIYCGFLFVKARGNPEAIGTAKDALLYTLIGAAILLGSWALAKFIEATVKSLS